MLIDDINISVKGGNGGNGRISFKRNAQTSRGGPDGGNGGEGGNIYLQGQDDTTLLSQFAYRKNLSAENGVDGSKQNMHGRNGNDLIVKLPIGTFVTDLATKETIEIINDDKILIAKGGKGGRGNNEFKSATVQAPKYRELGQQGEIKNLNLVLKFIADIGIIGLPNAGKSSLLQVLTNAHPKIGDYPFTTTEPNLGVLDDVLIADIPGLIEGASEGKGLGVNFLKHIEKTKELLHCIDVNSESIINDYHVIRTELEKYNSELIKKPEILLLCKIDTVSKEILNTKMNQAKKLNKNVLAISILNDSDILNLKKILLNQN